MPDAGIRAQHQPGGVIHDLGYRGYDGPRLGRVQIVKALTWHSFRSAFGIGRGVKGKIVPVLTFIAMCLPALVNAFAVARGNAAPVRLRRLHAVAAGGPGHDLHRRPGARTRLP